MGVPGCSQNLWISLLKTIPGPIATLGGIRDFLALPNFVAQSKPISFNNLASPPQNRVVALQRCGDCQENVHKSSPLLHTNHPANSRMHSPCTGLHPANPPPARLLGQGVRKPLVHAIPRAGHPQGIHANGMNAAVLRRVSGDIAGSAHALRPPAPRHARAA